MKKLLTLVLVLSMASAASAGLQISVHTSPPGGETWDPQNPPDTEISIGPSEYLTLDIWTDEDVLPGGGLEGAYGIVCRTAEATISGGVNAFPAEPSIYVYALDLFDGRAGSVALIALGTAPSIPAGTTIVDQIEFHCILENVDTIIELVYDPAWPSAASQVVDTVTIHQTPEPMTMALLGLGGLGLLRRRRS